MAARFRACPVCSERAWRGTAYERLVTELEIGHDQVAHRIYNALLCAGIVTVMQLTELTDPEITRIPGIGPQRLRRLRTRVPRPGPVGRPGEASEAAALRKTAHLLDEQYADGAYELVAALGRALAEAADEFDYCARMNARKDPGDLPELPTPTAEALAAAAVVYLEHPETIIGRARSGVAALQGASAA